MLRQVDVLIFFKGLDARAIPHENSIAGIEIPHVHYYSPGLREMDDEKKRQALVGEFCPACRDAACIALLSMR